MKRPEAGNSKLKVGGDSRLSSNLAQASWINSSPGGDPRMAEKGRRWVVQV